VIRKAVHGVKKKKGGKIQRRCRSPGGSGFCASPCWIPGRGGGFPRKIARISHEFTGYPPNDSLPISEIEHPADHGFWAAGHR